MFLPKPGGGTAALALGWTALERLEGARPLNVVFVLPLTLLVVLRALLGVRGDTVMVKVKSFFSERNKWDANLEPPY